MREASVMKKLSSDLSSYNVFTHSCVPPTVIYLPYRVSGSTLTYGRRAFSVAGPMAWNSLPDFIRDPTSSKDCFRRLLKTYRYLFARVTSAYSALGVLIDYALYKSTHSLTCQSQSVYSGDRHASAVIYCVDRSLPSLPSHPRLLLVNQMVHVQSILASHRRLNVHVGAEKTTETQGESAIHSRFTGNK